MSQTIDQKVVEMRFDNKQFESNVSTTLSTLDKLKQSLNLTGAAKGLENVSVAAKRVDMSGLGGAVEAVGLKFSALQTIGVTALANITNSAVNAGKRIVSSLTIDPIKTGFQEYETQINAIQTILANTSSKGTTLKDVNTALDTLNTYADKTIYNFTEMTRNIGTFTAAGVDLHTSVDSIQGIANLAAVSGSTSQQASTAMYQLSQALAAGTVKLMDWNSVVNAGMGGEMFQNALKETSRLLGTGADAAIKAEGSFRESLKSGWLTSEVLTETLKKFTTTGANERVAEYTKLSKEAVEAALKSAEAQYGEADAIEYASKALAKKSGKNADEIKKTLEFAKTAEDAATKVKTFSQLWDTLKESAQSGWTSTWELIVGDFEEAKTLFTEVSDTIGNMLSESANARNQLLAGALQKTSASDYISKLTGASKESVQQLMELGKETGYTSEEFKKLATTLAKNDPNMRAVITNLTKMSSGEKDVVEYISDITGMSEKSIKELQKLGKETGYTSREFKELARTLSEGDRKMEMTITNLLMMSDEMNKLSGRELLIDSLRNVFNGLLSVIQPVKEAFREIFPAMTSKQLYSIIEGIHDLTEKFKLSEATSDNLKRTFKGLFAVLDIVKMGISAIFKVISPLVGEMVGLGGGILEVTASFGDWLVNLRDTIKETDVFRNTLEGIINFVKTVASGIRDLAVAIKDNFIAPGLELFSGLLDRIKERLSQIGTASEAMESVVSKAFKAIGAALVESDFLKMLQSLWKGVQILVKGITDTLGALTGGLVEKVNNFEFKALLDTFNTGVLGAILLAMRKFAKNINKPFDSLSDTLENVTGILESVKGCLQAYQNQLNAQTLIKIATAIGLLAASILVISLIDSEKLSVALGSITVLFGDLMASMFVFSKISGSLKGVVKASMAMIAMSTSILILAFALKQIGDLDMASMGVGLLGVLGLTAIMVGAAKVMSSGGKTIIKGATQMVIFASAIKVLASACKDLSTLSWEELAKGLVGVGVLVGEIALFLRVAKIDSKVIGTATGIVILGAAMKILASACYDFAQMKWEELGKGLASIGGLLLEVSAFTRLTGNAKHVISSGVALVAIGAAMKIFASAVKDFGAMKWDEIGRGLTAMAGSLLSVAIALKLMPKNMITMGAGMIGVAAALVIMSEAVGRMSEMTWDEIGRGLATLGGSMLILAVALKVMTGTLSGSAALLVAVGALAVLAPVMKVLGSMSWTEIGKGLVAIAGAFTILGVAGLLLSPVVGTILALAGSFTLIGVSILAIGGGLLAIGAGLSAVAVGITALAAALAGGVTAIVAGITAIVMGFISLIPAILQKFGEGIVALAGVIVDGAPAIGEAAKALVLTLVDVLVECIPAITTGALELISGVIEGLAKYAPKIVEGLFNFLVGVLEVLKEKVPDLVKLGVDVFAEFFSGIFDALTGLDSDIILKAIAGIGFVAALMYALAGLTAIAPLAMKGVLAAGIVIAEIALVLAAIGGLAQIPGLDWLISEGGQFLELIGNAIGGFIGGIIGGIMGGITGQLPGIGTDLSNFMTNAKPFIDGSQSIDSAALSGVKTLAEMILVLTGASILEGLTSWLTGKSSLASFGEDIAAFGPHIKQFSDSITGIDGSAITAAANAAKALAEMSNIIPNEGGLKAWFTGENSLSKFGSDIVAFGSNMKAYSDAVIGVNPAAIIASTNAGKALADLANTIPSEGGMKAWFTGEQSLSKFGSDIVGFGACLKAYSDAVIGVNPAAVIAGTNAAKCIAELANTIPSEGGMKAWFTGEKSIAAFGDKIVSFGKDFSEYATSIAGIDANVVTATSNAASSIVTLANSLPEDKLFKNETTLAEFGSQLASFGTHFSNYYNTISGINATALVSTTTQIGKLVGLFEEMVGLDTSGASGFSKALGKLAKSGIDKFIETFETAGQGAMQTIKDFFDSVETTVNGYQDDFLVSGKTVMAGFIAGFEIKKSVIKTDFTTLMTDLTILMNGYQDDFLVSGKTVMVGFITGVEIKKPIVLATITTMMNDVVAKLDRYVDFYNAGKACVQGFADGITANTFMAQARAAAMAQAAFEAAMAVLEINSPSKLFRRGAASIPEGFAMGIQDKMQMVKSSSEEMAEAAINTTKGVISRLADMVTSDIDAQPTIRPILDLSDVESGTSRLNTMFSRSQAMSISSGMNRDTSGEIQNGEPGSKAGNTFNFTQNNYSPKSLSRVEIYRQTKNQFSTFERRVNA